MSNTVQRIILANRLFHQIRNRFSSRQSLLVVRNKVSFEDKTGMSKWGYDTYSKPGFKTVISVIGGIAVTFGTLWTLNEITSSEKKKADYSDALIKEFKIYKDPDMGRVVRFHGFTLPDSVFTILPDLHRFAIKEDDVFVVSFPKSGTTWIQEITYLISTDLDFDKAKNDRLDVRFPYLEYLCPGYKEIEGYPSPRFIKTHLPISLLPVQVKDKKPKIIYIARNPRDVSVSYYHFCRMVTFLDFSGDYAKFFKKFIGDEVPYGSWLKHVTEGWEHRNDDNVLFITYEELHKDINASIMKIAGFLGKNITSDQAQQIANHCSFSQMKANRKTNYEWLKSEGMADPKESAFMRKGIVGDWKNYMNPEMEEDMDIYLGCLNKGIGYNNGS